MSNYIYSAPTGDGWLNLARDGYFLENNKKGDVILYFYVNKNAVIIGRNQNAWKECNIANMDADGVQLVRRHSGGGAVFHDNGNLNFSFITDEKHYDLNRQMRVILNAVSKLGLKAELSGRNDITVDGKKFSGNAFSLAKGNRSHHGTILVNADLTKLSNYLCVSKEKMRSKGIDSVRARVCNICELSRALLKNTARRVSMFLTERRLRKLRKGAKGLPHGSGVSEKLRSLILKPTSVSRSEILRFILICATALFAKRRFIPIVSIPS